MCVANLNVTLQPCGHRWYALVRACSTTTNLSNCPHKIRLQGWETRVESCPWCSNSSGLSSSPVSSTLDPATHKLFGNDARRASSSQSALEGPSSRTGLRLRTNSDHSVTSLTVSSSGSALGDPNGGDDADDLLFVVPDGDVAERNRLMNRRLEAYMVNDVPDAISSGRVVVPARNSPSSPDTGTSPSSSSSSLTMGSFLSRWGSGKRKMMQRGA